MISTTPVQSSLILHISRPVKALIKKFSLILLFITAALGIFISQNESKLAISVRTYVADVASPVISVIAAPFNFISNASDSTKNYFFVHSKNEELLQENRMLKKKLINLSGVAYENDGLRRLLNYVQETEHKYISAKVVGNTSGPFLRFVLIDAGQKDGVVKGQAVINEDGLVGRIVEVGKRSSRVLLLTDINSNIPVISNQTREHSIMSGNNDESPRLLYLPKDSKISEGEVMLTSGDGDMFPPGLHAGIMMVGADGIKRALPFVRWHKLDHLSVIDYKG